MNNAKRRRALKKARKVRGQDPMTPTIANLTRLMRQMGTTRAERRHGRVS